jgi:hypothetical protein
LRPAHLFVREHEVEDVEVLFHALTTHGLRDRDDLALDEPPQHYLRDRLAVRAADLGQERIGEQVVLALSESAPRLDLHSVRAHEVLIGHAPEERVDLDLIDRGSDLVVLDEVDKSIRVEVRHPDRASETLAIELFHRAPEAGVVPQGLVDEVQVHVLQPEPFEGPPERRPAV